jgi:hypothetical protein
VLGPFKLPRGSGSVSFEWREFLSRSPSSGARLAAAHEAYLSRLLVGAPHGFDLAFGDLWEIDPDRAAAFACRIVDARGASAPSILGSTLRLDLRGRTPSAALRARGMIADDDDTPLAFRLDPLELLYAAGRARSLALSYDESEPPDHATLAYELARLARPFFARWAFEQQESGPLLQLVAYDGAHR